MDVNVRYSASAEDLAMVVCFLAFHEIKESPRNTQKPMTDFLESRQDPQRLLTGKKIVQKIEVLALEWT